MKAPVYASRAALRQACTITFVLTLYMTIGIPFYDSYFSGGTINHSFRMILILALIVLMCDLVAFFIIVKINLIEGLVNSGFIDPGKMEAKWGPRLNPDGSMQTRYKARYFAMLAISLMLLLLLAVKGHYLVYLSCKLRNHQANEILNGPLPSGWSIYSSGENQIHLHRIYPYWWQSDSFYMFRTNEPINDDIDDYAANLASYGESLISSQKAKMENNIVLVYEVKSDLADKDVRILVPNKNVLIHYMGKPADNSKIIESIAALKIKWLEPLLSKIAPDKLSS